VPAVESPGHTETVIDTGLEYLPGDPVNVTVIHRERRITVTDHGGAVARAGRPPGWRGAVERVLAELDVNISRDGVVSLPVVGAGIGEAAIVDRISVASLSLYQELLELRS
jgi:hypothetical protein